MNYIKHLTGFFEKVTADKFLNPTHISLYIALFQFWNCNRFKNPISISRDEVMRISKISSKVTYHKCLKELHAAGYIKYEPSYNPFKGSHVFLFNFSDDLKPFSKSERNSSNFEPVTEQVADKSSTATETSSEPLPEQALVPFINNTNISNNQNFRNDSDLGGSAKKNENVITDANSIGRNEKEKKLRQKEKTILNTIPLPDEVVVFFLSQDFPELEANKFYNYFKSIGWLVGGKTPMADWQAAARNWMLNAQKFTSNERTDGIRHLDTSAGKDYSEPL